MNADHPNARPSDDPSADAPPFADADALQAYLLTIFPHWASAQSAMNVTAIGEGRATLALAHDDTHIRPGGTVSGPAMMMLADVAAFCAILTRVGRRPLVVTTSLHIDFLRRPRPVGVFGVAEVIKLGAKLAVGRVEIRSGSPGGEMVAHATATYGLPPEGVGAGIGKGST